VFEATRFDRGGFAFAFPVNQILAAAVSPAIWGGLVVDRCRADLRWRRSSASAQGNCVEVARDGENVVIRDSKDAGGAILSTPIEAWRRFIEFVKDPA
jgi:hypothetical protein